MLKSSFKQKQDLGAKATSADAAMDSLARLLVVRERSLKEAQDRLLEKGYEEHTVASALDRALACGLLDDARFAQTYIKGKLSAGWGQKRIERELYRFGIATEMIDGYPDDFFCEDEQVEQALEALKKHRSRSKNPKQAAYRYLIGKGYSSSVASSAVRAASSANESEGYDTEH